MSSTGCELQSFSPSMIVSLGVFPVTIMYEFTDPLRGVSKKMAVEREREI